jgi:transposase
LQVRVSGATVLRTLRQTSAQHVASPRVIGIDDWAFRKGQSYGTIIVDLEARRVIDLLPDRRADTPQTWLEGHPDIEFVSRDRSTEYASAIETGCPKAIQVADRWHLLANVRELAERYLKSTYSQLEPFSVPPEKAYLFLTRRPPFRRAIADKLREAGRQKRNQALYKQIQQFRQQGLSIRKTACLLHLHRNTVKKYYDARTCPSPRSQKQRRSMIDPYIPYLTKRQQEGCENAMQLWREIVSVGYPGSPRQIQRWLQQRRLHPSPNTPKVYIRAQPEIGPRQRPRLPSLRELSWTMIKTPISLTEREKVVLTYLISHPEVALVYSLLQQFNTMLKEQQPEQFADWIHKMQGSNVVLLANFARGLQLDFQAVVAAMTYSWSNGQTEGHVNRLKFIKGQMYGRAQFDLLRLRVLHSPHST